VHVSDAFDGVTFTDLDAGIAYAREIGDELIGRRADETVAGLPAGLVYLGMSLGVVSAQRLAQQRPGARGAVLLYSCLPADAFGGWPSGLRAQVHGMDDDPYFAHEGDVDAARALAAAEPSVELVVHPGSGHLFADASSPDHDPEAAARLTERVLAFLGELDAAVA
jgi:dienelactone hydrolase